jgi:hypothetical protein
MTPRTKTPEGPVAVHRLALGLVLAFGFCSSGCGNSVYLVRVSQAEEAFEEAKSLGAEESAPYEYYSAKLRIEEARRQAAQAEYGNAAHLSREARGYSVLAIERTKKVATEEKAEEARVPADSQPKARTRSPSESPAFSSSATVDTKKSVP